MAPVLIRRVLGSSIWSTLDASQPALSQRDYNTGMHPATIAIPIGVFAALVIILCSVKARRINRAKMGHTHIPVSPPRLRDAPRTRRRPEAGWVSPPASDDVLDPPPPYVPLQTLEPAHKPADDTLERPADAERNVGNHGHVRSMLDV